jgi:GGDEF domain-containing protein
MVPARTKPAQLARRLHAAPADRSAEPAVSPRLLRPVATDVVLGGLFIVAVAAWASGVAAAAAIAATAVAVAAVRIVLTVRDGRALVRNAVDRDEVTGLGNERAFAEELERRLADGPAEATVLALFDLHGVDRYAERYGAAAADALLRRLARRLETAADDPSHVFAAGPARLAVLERVGRIGAEPPVSAAVSALSHEAEGFEVAAVAGVVRLPDDADTAARALALADARLSMIEPGDATSGA